MSNPSDQTPGFFDQLAATDKTAVPDVFSSADELEIEPNGAASELLEEAENNVELTPEKGRFSPELRRALVELMRTGVVLASGKSQIFELLCRYQSQVEDYLADMYLRLLIDQQAGVALLLQQQDEDDFEDEEDRSALISRRTLSLYDTLLLLVLRKHYQERQTTGEQQVIIDIDRIEAQLTPFLPLTNSSRGDRRKLSGAITKMKEKKLLSPVRGEEDRWEITPVIRYVVNAEFLEQMMGEYASLVGNLSDGESE